MGDVLEIGDRLLISIDDDDYLEDSVETKTTLKEKGKQDNINDLKATKNESDIEETSKEDINDSSEETDSATEIEDIIKEAVDRNKDEEKVVNEEGTKLNEKKTRKKSRRVWKTSEQRMYLTYFYNNESQYPSKKEKLQLSNDLQISTKQVNTWFHNRRAADRKKAKEELSLVTMVRIERWENLYGMIAPNKRTKRKSSEKTS
eukprot:TCONS_00068785-protein